MALLSRFLKLTLGGLASLSALMMCYLAAALIGGVLAASTATFEAAGDQKTITIGLVAGAIHNDFLLPSNAQTKAQFAFLEPHDIPLNHPNAEWLMLGWGAHDFYTSVGTYSDVSLSASVKAILGDTAVLRVDVLGAIGRPDVVRWLHISPTQYEALLTGIKGSFDPSLRPLPEAPKTQGHFFPAQGVFNLFNTCNTWVGKRLRTAGVSFGAWTPIPASISLSLWRFHPDKTAGK